MSQEIQFLFHALRQQWLSEAQAEDFWRTWQAQKDKADIGQVAQQQKLLDEDQVREARELAGITLTLQRFPTIGNYETVELLGAGSHGVTFRAQPELSSDNVAIKVLAPRLHDDLVYLQEFARQAKAATSLTIENAATTLATGEVEGHPYLVSEFVPGENLNQVLQRAGPLPEDKALQFVRAIALALAQAHAKGLVHRGLQPTAIRRTPDGSFRLVDLGLAKEAPDKTLLHIALRIGIPHYVAPEQASGNPGDIRSDMFSLGGILYFAVTGNPPFSGEYASALLPELAQGKTVRGIPAPAEGNPDLSERICSLLTRLMARAPEDRYSTPEALLADLNELEAGKALQHPSLNEAQTFFRESAAASSSVRGTGAPQGAGVPKERPEAGAKADSSDKPKASAPETARSGPAQGKPSSRLGRHRSAAAPNPMRRVVGLGLPIVLILFGLIFFRRGQEDSSDESPPDESTTTSILSAMQALQREYAAIQKLLEKPDQIEEARAKLTEFRMKVQDNPAFKRLVDNALTQIATLEKNAQETEKEALKSKVPPVNIVANGNFERGEEKQPEDWTLVGETGKWEDKEAAEGKHCLGVSSYLKEGTKKYASPYWRGTVYPLEPHQLYKASFQIRTDQWRKGDNAYVFIGCGQRNFEPSPPWGKEEFVFLTPTVTEETASFDGAAPADRKQAEARIGVFERPGHVYFDDLRVVKVKAWHPKFQGISLGVNEKVESGMYTFKLTWKIPSSNYARCLQNFSARFAETAWELDENRFILYAHEVEKYPQKKGLLLSIGTDYHFKAASLRVEVSKDLGNWILLHTQNEKGSKSISLPSELYPTDTFYVKFTADGYCRLSAYTYMAELEGKTPTRFIGTTEFIE